MGIGTDSRIDDMGLPRTQRLGMISLSGKLTEEEKAQIKRKWKKDHRPLTTLQYFHAKNAGRPMDLGTSYGDLWTCEEAIAYGSRGADIGDSKFNDRETKFWSWEKALALFVIIAYLVYYLIK